MTPTDYWCTVWVGGALCGGGAGIILGGLWVDWRRYPSKRWALVAGLAVLAGVVVALAGIGEIR